LDQAGKKEEAIKQYRATIEMAWKVEEKRFGGLGNRWVVAETAGYLKPHLDAEKDKAELAQLAERIDILNKKPRAVTPIAIPLADQLSSLDMIDHTARVNFDVDGSGMAKQWNWIKPNVAWLVYDQRGTGKPTSALQLFGNVTFWCFWENGYVAMSSLDNNHDGQLAGQELQHLALWHDVNSNGVADAGEVKPLAEHGIVSLSCQYEHDTAHPDRIPFSARGVTYKNGQTRPSYDLLLHSK
jgi:hypothetical protein